MKTILFLLITASLLLGACQAAPAAPTLPPALTLPATGTLVPATATPRPTHTPIPVPTSTPTLTPTATADTEELTLAFQYFAILDNLIGRIAMTTDELDQGKLNQGQAKVRIQDYHRYLNAFKPEIQANGMPYYDEIARQFDAVLEASTRWWRGESDAKTLRQEIFAIQESFQPRKEELHTALVALGDGNSTFEQDLDAYFNDVFYQSGQTMKDESTADIFQTQVSHRSSWSGMALTLGKFAKDQGYTAPDETFHCDFAIPEMDGYLWYDFIFPDRTLVVFTNDYGLGQAVERRPLEEPPVDAVASRELVNELFKNSLLPALKQQHRGLKVLQQEWVDTPRPMLQVIVRLPKASYLVTTVMERGKKTATFSKDVIRGMWIFTEGDSVYTIIHQGDYDQPDGGTDPLNLTDAKRTELVLEGLANIQQTCTFK